METEVKLRIACYGQTSAFRKTIKVYLFLLSCFALYPPLGL